MPGYHQVLVKKPVESKSIWGALEIESDAARRDGESINRIGVAAISELIHRQAAIGCAC